MATNTTKLGLVKPDLKDIADITVINNNMDLIDQFATNADAAINEVSSSLSDHAGQHAVGGSDPLTLSMLGVNATAEELNYVDGVTSNIQMQLDNKDELGAANTALNNAKEYADDVSNAALGEAKQYTDDSITGLINGAPTTLDTLKEIADAMAENEDVVEALDQAIGNKADIGHTHTHEELGIEFVVATAEAHISDKNNPHNVTIEQIGAAPSGYGYGDNLYVGAETGESITDKIDALTATWGSRATKQYLIYDADFNVYSIQATIAKYSETVTLIFGMMYDGRNIMRRKTGGVWQPWEVWGPSDFAPSGYGLGWAASLNTYNGGDLDTLTAPGWYFWDSKDTSTTIAGISSQYWYVHVVAYGDGHLHCRQEIHPTTRNTCSPIVRKCSGGTWGEWAWESPPMNVGVEYRTTMYDNGKALYLQRGDNGAIFYRRHGEDAWYAMASRIDGTFANVVAANPTAQNPATRQLRNSTIVSTETTPSYNGEICWVYE